MIPDIVIEIEDLVKTSLVDFINRAEIGWTFSNYHTPGKNGIFYVIFIRKKSPGCSPRRLSITFETEDCKEVIIRRNLNGELLEDIVDLEDREKIVNIGINWILGLICETSKEEES